MAARVEIATSEQGMKRKVYLASSGVPTNWLIASCMIFAAWDWSTMACIYSETRLFLALTHTNLLLNLSMCSGQLHVDLYLFPKTEPES